MIGVELGDDLLHFIFAQRRSPAGPRQHGLQLRNAQRSTAVLVKDAKRFLEAGLGRFFLPESGTQVLTE